MVYNYINQYWLINERLDNMIYLKVIGKNEETWFFYGTDIKP